jgi:hypothetical protein
MNTIISIEGNIGSGKSTLISLILGAKRPDLGHVSFYNQTGDIVEISNVNFGYVGPTPLLFEDTLRNNLIYGNSIHISDLGGTRWSYIGDSTVFMSDGNLQYNYAATKSGKISELMESRGKGFALDIGYTYMRKKKSTPTRLTVCPNIRYGGRIREYQEYKWKLGVAIMDIGRIDFNNQTVATTYTNANGNTRNLDLEFYKGVFALDRRLQFDYSGNPGSEFELAKAYSHYTATRFQFQFDYNYKNNIFFNFSGSQRLPMPGAISMVAPNILSLTTRFEKMQYEWGVPISLIEYQHPIMGLYFRYGPFYLGTNHLLETIGLRNIRGADLFFGLKFNFSNFKGV